MATHRHVKKIGENCENSDISKTSRLLMKGRPQLFETYGSVTAIDTTNFLQQYNDKIKWKETGDRSVDLGSGDGGVTKILESFLPPNYESLIGYDINEEMVLYSNENHRNNRLEFKLFDIEGDLPCDMYQSCDHVFSFYTLHWVRNQEKAFQNIYDMMDEGGDCHLTFYGDTYVYDAFSSLADIDQWRASHKNINEFLSPYYDCKEPDLIISKLMDKIGFKNIDVKCKQLSHDYETVQDFINIMLTVSPFDVPDELMEEYIEDVKKVARDLRLIRVKDNTEFVHYKYNLMVVYAQK